MDPLAWAPLLDLKPMSGTIDIDRLTIIDHDSSNHTNPLLRTV